MRPIPADSLGHAHGLLRAIDTRGRLRADEFVTEFSLEELFPPDLENALGRLRHFISYGRAAGLVKEDRGVVELTDVGRRYIRAGEADAPFAISEQQAEWLRRQLREKHMTDSIFHGLAIGLSLLASCPPGGRVSTMDFGRSMAYLGRAGWDNDNTLLIQGERHLILLTDMELLDGEHRLTPTGEQLRGDLTLPVHMGLLDIAAQLNPGGADAVRAAAEEEWAQAAPEPTVDEAPEPSEPEPGRERRQRLPDRRPVGGRRRRVTAPTDRPARERAALPTLRAAAGLRGRAAAGRHTRHAARGLAAAGRVSAAPVCRSARRGRPGAVRCAAGERGPARVGPCRRAARERAARGIGRAARERGAGGVGSCRFAARERGTARVAAPPASVAAGGVGLRRFAARECRPQGSAAPPAGAPTRHASAPAGAPPRGRGRLGPRRSPPAGAPQASTARVGGAPPASCAGVASARRADAARSPASAGPRRRPLRLRLTRPRRRRAPVGPPPVAPHTGARRRACRPSTPHPGRARRAAGSVATVAGSIRAVSAPPAAAAPARPAAAEPHDDAADARCRAPQCPRSSRPGRSGRPPRPPACACRTAVYGNVAAALNAGKHLLLTGGRGMGKTWLALAITRAAAQAGKARGATVVTGAPALDLVVDAAARGRWVIVDELDQSRPGRGAAPALELPRRRAGHDRRRGGGARRRLADGRDVER